MFGPVYEDMMRFEEELDRQEREMPEVALEMPIFKLTMRNVRMTAMEETLVKDAAARMVNNDIGCLPVVDDDGLLVGIVTERDILVKGTPDMEAAGRMQVSEIMTKNPTTVHRDDTIGVAIRRMHDGHYRHLPVVGDSNRVRGVLSVRNIMEFVVDHFPAEVLALPPEPVERNPMRTPEGA